MLLATGTMTGTRSNSYAKIMKPLTFIVITLVCCIISGNAFQPVRPTWPKRTSSFFNTETLIIYPSRTPQHWIGQRTTQLRMQECNSTLEKNSNSTGTNSTQTSNSNSTVISPAPNGTRATAVYTLILMNLGVFLADKVLRMPFVMKWLYLFHTDWSWWQPLTNCFCHLNRIDLSSNLLLMFLLGKSVEEDLGWGGLIFSYIFCGVMASIVSLLLLPSKTVSIGASGAVFGLMAVSTFAKTSWEGLLDWRKFVEIAVLGEFVYLEWVLNQSQAAKVCKFCVNRVAHLAGAAAGVIMVIGMRVVVTRFEQSEKMEQDKAKKLLEKLDKIRSLYSSEASEKSC